MTAKEEYQVFLQTPFWLELRARCFARDGMRCRRCGRSDLPLHAHHLFYRTGWLNTLLEDLETVCGACHETIHSLLNKPKPPAANPGFMVAKQRFEEAVRIRRREESIHRRKKKDEKRKRPIIMFGYNPR